MTDQAPTNITEKLQLAQKLSAELLSGRFILQNFLPLMFNYLEKYFPAIYDESTNQNDNSSFVAHSSSLANQPISLHEACNMILSNFFKADEANQALYKIIISINSLKDYKTPSLQILAYQAHKYIESSGSSGRSVEFILTSISLLEHENEPEAIEVLTPAITYCSDHVIPFMQQGSADDIALFGQCVRFYHSET